MIFADKKKEEVSESNTWLGKWARELTKKRKTRSLREVLEYSLSALDEAYSQLLAVEGGLRKVPGIGEKTIPALHSSYNSFKNAIRRVIREMERKQMLTDEGREKLAGLFDQETRTVQELINALSAFPSPEEVPPEEREKAKSALPELLKRMKQLTMIAEAIKKEYRATFEGIEKTEEKKLYDKKFTEEEKTGQDIGREMDILNKHIVDIENTFTQVEQGIGEIETEDAQGLKILNNAYQEAYRGFQEFTKSLRNLTSVSRKPLVSGSKK